MHMLLYYYNEVKINEIIKEKRLALGYTQEQLAKFLNLTIVSFKILFNA